MLGWKTVILITCVVLRACWVLIVWTAEVDIAKTHYLMWEASLSKAVVFITHSSGTCCIESACQDTHTHTHSLPKSPLHLASFQPNDGHYHFSITFAGLNCSISGVLCYFRKLKNIQPATVNTIFKLKGSQVQSKCILLYSTLCVFLTVFDVRFYNFRFKAFMQVKHQISTQYNILYCISSGLYVVYSIFPMNT